MKTITLTNQEAELLDEILGSYQDEGPEGYGWASSELKALRETVEKQISAERGREEK